MKRIFEKNSALTICVFLITLYIFAAFEEYIIHKYIMHQKIDLPYLKETYEDHHRHHLNTNKDFTIKNNDPSNICFSFMTTVPLFIITVSSLYAIFYRILSFNIIVISVIIILIIHMVVWNTLHSYIHKLEVNRICKNAVYGVTKEYINEENPYVKWSLENHKAHHYFKGDEKGNWNVVFPGPDYILGTHNTIPK